MYPNYLVFMREKLHVVFIIVKSPLWIKLYIQNTTDLSNQILPWTHLILLCIEKFSYKVIAYLLRDYNDKTKR